MERIATTQVLNLDYEPLLSLLIQRWHGVVTNETYKKSLLLVVEKILYFQPIKRIMVYPELNFLVSPEIQEWMIKYVFEPTKINKVEKIAFVIPKDITQKMVIEYLSIIRIMEDTKENLYELQYFYTENEAYQWLLK